MMATTPKITQRLKSLPDTPGVYLFKSTDGEIIYIGKALNLKKRVTSYFQNRPTSPKIEVLKTRIGDVEIVETQTEVDALLLEASLVRAHCPKYNTQLKDDKSYPLLKITNERFPRILVTRRRTDGKATYYGPYTDGKLLREAVRMLNNLFPIRKCQTLPKKACLYYHIGQCLAPCIKPDIHDEYMRVINEVKTFLDGAGRKSLIDYLTERMQAAASELRFEDAKFFKDQIEALGWFRKKRFYSKRPEIGIGLRATMELKQALGMRRLPEKIVCFDVSNIQGAQAVASKVCFYRELSLPMEYRRYKIKTVRGIDDYAMIQEALTRMIRGVQDGKENGFPDVVMIDGGKGHLNAALKIVRDLGVEDFELISIAKQFEYVYSPALAHPIAFPPGSSALRLLAKIRDEAHRFAITYHRGLKTKELSRSLLDQIEGIGEKRKRILLSAFASLEELSETSVEWLACLEGMNESAARRVKEFLAKKFSL